MGGVAVKQKDWAIIGIITVLGPRDILTIKMTGPAKELAAEKANFLEFAKNLGFVASEESTTNSESK